MPPSIRLHLYDTLSQRLTPLIPKRPDEVRVYCCGPTTYDVAHVGHARAAITPDVLVRHLRGQGVKVTYARNITDVDDKILKRAAESGEEPTVLSARMAKLYQEDVAAIACVKPDIEPKVSEHIPDIIELIETLIREGAAYEVTMPNGARDVYYAVRKFPGYGKLSKRNIEEQEVGARVESSEEKRDPLDFALWKGCTTDAWGWDSPWGKGRPGWHIECSAMANRYLGHGFDVHCGGMDLIFPHHENEIAQSEAAHPNQGPFAQLWIHNGFVNVDKEKMAKSLGNFVTMRDVFARNDPEGLRYFLLTVHYRSPIQFDTVKLDTGRVEFPGVIEAERRVDYLYGVLERLAALYRGAVEQTLATVPRELEPFAKVAREGRIRVEEALDDDLNTPVALAAIAELAKAGNELCDLIQKRHKDKAIAETAPHVAVQIALAIRSALEPLGLLTASASAYQARCRTRRLAIRGLTPEGIEAAVTARRQAREAKDFARADTLRAELDAAGVEVSDGPAGSVWRVVP
ncbi:MAG TPA: cysteine--tRNA ligase, partial [Polyangiaceae bacterium]